MARKQLITVLDLDADRMTALQADVSDHAVTLRSWLTATMPEGLLAGAPEGVGSWLHQQLGAAGMTRGHLVLSMGRSDVVLKKLSFPAGQAGLVQDDLAGMVRLQMSRQLTMPVDSAAIDYAPMGNPALPGPDGQVSVIAGAMPGERLEWCNGLAKALGMRLARVSLRGFGAAALVREFSQRHEKPVVAVALGFRTAEFVIVEDGQMVFARAADAPRPADDADLEAYAERVAVELRRTWTSYRMGSPSEQVPLIAVLAEGTLAKAVGERCGAAVEGDWEMVSWPSGVDTLPAVATADRAAITPMIGLLHEMAQDRPAIDFAHPRRATDRRAATRQKALAGAFAAIVLLGSGWAIADMKLKGLESQLSKLKTQQSGLQSELDEFLIEHARVNHIETWTSARVDWLAHLETLNRQLPDPRQSLLDEVTGFMRSPVVFSPKGTYPQGAWSSEPSTIFKIGGRVANRDVAANLRGRLIASDLYRVESIGADVADSYSLELTTFLPEPLTLPQGASAPPPPASGDGLLRVPEPKQAPATAPGVKPVAKPPAAKTPKGAKPPAKPTDKPAAKSGGGAP